MCCLEWNLLRIVSIYDCDAGRMRMGVGMKMRVYVWMARRWSCRWGSHVRVRMGVRMGVGRVRRCGIVLVVRVRVCGVDTPSPGHPYSSLLKWKNRKKGKFFEVQVLEYPFSQAFLPFSY